MDPLCITSRLRQAPFALSVPHCTGGTAPRDIFLSLFPVQLGTVIGYIENQQKNHGKKSFRVEYVALLEEFGEEHDPRYIFKTGEA